MEVIWSVLMTKGHSMAGWRVGFLVGSPEIVSALGKLKSYLSAGLPILMTDVPPNALDIAERGLALDNLLYQRDLQGGEEAIVDAVDLHRILKHGNSTFVLAI